MKKGERPYRGSVPAAIRVDSGEVIGCAGRSTARRTYKASASTRPSLGGRGRPKGTMELSGGASGDQAEMVLAGRLLGSGEDNAGAET